MESCRVRIVRLDAHLSPELEVEGTDARVEPSAHEEVVRVVAVHAVGLQDRLLGEASMSNRVSIAACAVSTNLLEHESQDICDEGHGIARKHGH
jgi:hypothetical protein